MHALPRQTLPTAGWCDKCMRACSHTAVLPSVTAMAQPVGDAPPGDAARRSEPVSLNWMVCKLLLAVSSAAPTSSCSIDILRRCISTTAADTLRVLFNAGSPLVPQVLRARGSFADFSRSNRGSESPHDRVRARASNRACQRGSLRKGAGLLHAQSLDGCCCIYHVSHLARGSMLPR